jgi:DNA-binding NtrC family response regulator
LADGGTLFLDEVTELPAQLQAKLLRAIETRTFFRVGGVRKVEVNVRIVAATNRNLETVVNDGVFRSDLLYRINGFQISLAPLRERPEDIEPLTRYLLKQIAGTHPPELTDDAFAALRAYHWPGNVRQLKNCLERAVILSNNGRITLAELPPEVTRPPMVVPVMGGVVAPATGTGGEIPMPVVAGPSTPGSLREVERQQILAALEKTGWHRGKTAEILGISPSTLYRRLRDYDLERRR